MKDSPIPANLLCLPQAINLLSMGLVFATFHKTLEPGFVTQT